MIDTLTRPKRVRLIFAAERNVFLIEYFGRSFILLTFKSKLCDSMGKRERERDLLSKFTRRLFKGMNIACVTRDYVLRRLRAPKIEYLEDKGELT